MTSYLLTRATHIHTSKQLFLILPRNEGLLVRRLVVQSRQHQRFARLHRSLVGFEDSALKWHLHKSRLRLSHQPFQLQQHVSGGTDDPRVHEMMLI